MLETLDQPDTIDFLIPPEGLMPFEDLSVRKTDARERAADLIASNRLITGFNRGVSYIMLNATSERAIDDLYASKGEARQNKPLSLIASRAIEDMIYPPLGREAHSLGVDLERVDRRWHQYVKNPRLLKSVFGSIGFLQIPVNEKLVERVQDELYSRQVENPELVIHRILSGEKDERYIQIYYPEGHVPMSKLCQLIESRGVPFIGITSANRSGQHEIVDQEEGANFARHAGIPIYLHDDEYPVSPQPGRVQGSYPIARFEKAGLRIVRAGNVSNETLKILFNNQIQVDEGNPKFPAVEVPPYILEGLSPQHCRQAIISFLNGGNPEKIHNYYKNRVSL